MNTTQALRLALYYRGLSALSFAVGIGIAVVGLGAGLGETVAILAADFPSRVDEAVAAANLPVALGSAVVGVLVWQVGTWAAFFLAIDKAVDAEPADAPSDRARDDDRSVVAETEDEAENASAASPRQDPIVPSSSGGNADGSASADRQSEVPGTAPTVGAESAPDDGATASAGRTGSPQPHDDDTDPAASTDEGSAETLAADGENVFDDETADAPVDADTCGDCGYPNKEGVSFCANCGAEL